MAGVPMPARDPETERRDKQRASLHEIMDLAAQFFEEQLQSAAGATARAYLRNRGLTSVTIKKFRLGYAPDSRNALKEFLAARGVEKNQLEACGLVVFGPDIPVSYDRFRDRIMFPIEDTKGRIIAFGGRALSPDAKAKYLNSPDTELFHKGEVLYNYSRARKAQDKGGILIAVEGYMDVIALAQVGIDHAVAPLGTALTESQLELLWKTASEPVLAFDGDQAGYRAAYRVADIAFGKLEIGRSLRFAILPDGKDPDDIVRSGGKEAFDNLLQNASPLREFFILRRRSEMDVDTPEGKAAFEKQLYADIDAIRDPVLKKYYRSHLRLRIFEVLTGRARDVSSEEAARLKASISGNKLVETILGFCVEYPEMIPDHMERLMKIEHKVDSFEYRLFVRELYRLYVEFGDVSVSDIYNKIDEKFADLLDLVHGREWMKPIRNRANEVIDHKRIERGHRLRFLFPMVRYNPPIFLVAEILEFLFEKLQLTITEAEYLTNAAGMSETEFIGYQREIIDGHASLREREQALYEQLRALAGRLPMAA